jgi:hypothetical protein
VAWRFGRFGGSGANPFGNIHTVTNDGSVTTGSTNLMSGYSIIEAHSHDEALEAAKACPFLDMGGSLEVSQLMQMPG